MESPSPGDETFAARVSLRFAQFGGALLLLSAILVTLDVLSRRLFNVVPFYSFELTEYGFAVAVSLGYGYALLSKAHIRVDVLYVRLPLPLRSLLDVVALLALGLIVGILAYYALQITTDSYALRSRSNSTLAVPLVIPHLLWTLGLLWFAVIVVLLLARALRHLLRRRYDEVARLIGSGEPPA